MKYFIFFYFICSFSITAQISNFWSVYKIQDFIFDGDVMYYVSQGDAGGGSGFVARTDFSDATPTIEYLVNNILYPRAITFDANYIYYTTGSKIYKIPKNVPTPTPILIYSGQLQCKALYLKNDELYLGEINKVSKINVTVTNPTKYDLVTGLSDIVLSFTEYNNELYFSYGGNVSKINFNTNTPASTSVISNLTSKIYGMDFNSNFLYLEQTAINTNQRFLKFDILNLNLGFESINIGFSNAGVGFKFKGNDLYFGRPISNMIYKYENITTLSLDEFIFKKQILKIYPNPSSDFLNVSDLKELKNYKIFDTNGVLVESGEVSSSKEINIQNLSSGLYHLSIDDVGYYKFIKK
jgi:hypothetical protein